MQKDLQPYCLIRNDIATKDGIVMEDRRISAALQGKALKQLHLNHKGIEKTRLLAHEAIYWVNVNADTEKIVKKMPHLSGFSTNMTKQ